MFRKRAATLVAALVAVALGVATVASATTTTPTTTTPTTTTPTTTTPTTTTTTATTPTTTATTPTTTATTPTTTTPTSSSAYFSYTPVAGMTTVSASSAASDASEPSAAPAGAYEIFTTFNCQCYNGQKTIVDRVGYYDAATDAGFGRAKPLEKHNMYVRVVGIIVAGPNHRHVSGEKGQAYAYAVRPSTGQQIKTIASYDTRILGDKRSFGIVTGYCEGYGKCPQWVNTAASP